MTVSQILEKLNLIFQNNVNLIGNCIYLHLKIPKLTLVIIVVIDYENEMSTSAERGQQSQPTATVYHPQLKLTVSDLATNAAAAAHLAASTNTSGLVAAGNTLVGLNPFLRTSAAVSLNSMQIQRPPSFLTSSNQSTVTRGSDGSASVQASSVLKSSGNVIARDLYPQHHLSK